MKFLGCGCSHAPAYARARNHTFLRFTTGQKGRNTGRGREGMFRCYYGEKLSVYAGRNVNGELFWLVNIGKASRGYAYDARR